MSDHQCDTCGKYLYTRADGEKHLRYMQALNDIDRLRAENEQLSVISQTVSRDLTEEIERLRAENERLKQDAERYRWLRENVVHCELVGWKTTGSLNAMDETVDAALAAGGEK